MSLNSWGAVTGTYQKADLVYHGFIREPNGRYIEVDDPAAGTIGAPEFQGTWPAVINDNGEVAGIYWDSPNNVHGFLRSQQGEFTVDDPNANGSTFIALEQGLNNRGAVVGWYFVGPVAYGFVREPDGKFITIEPNTASPATQVGGINSAGAVAALFVNSTGPFLFSGYLQKPDGQTTIFNVSGPDGAIGTVAYTLNSRDEVTGNSVDANGADHGFIGFANGSIETFDAPNAGTGRLQGTRPTTINDSGQVVGWFLDSNNVAHGFIFSPR